MEDGKTLTTKYAHCSELLVSAGQEVKQGDVIAKVGSTGDSTGPHLHLEVLVDGQYLNPLYFTDTGDHTGTSLIPGSAGGPEIPRISRRSYGRWRLCGADYRGAETSRKALCVRRFGAKQL